MQLTCKSSYSLLFIAYIAVSQACFQRQKFSSRCIMQWKTGARNQSQISWVNFFCSTF